VPDVPAKETLAPNWNVAPTNDVRAVLERSPRGEEGSDTVQRELRPLRWGLVPSWAKEVKVSARMIHARVETVHEKPTYRRGLISPIPTSSRPIPEAWNLAPTRCDRRAFPSRWHLWTRPPLIIGAAKRDRDLQRLLAVIFARKYVVYF
jgi:hypothetical protein